MNSKLERQLSVKRVYLSTVSEIITTAVHSIRYFMLFRFQGNKGANSTVKFSNTVVEYKSRP
jgi:hypothetical protein